MERLEREETQGQQAMIAKFQAMLKPEQKAAHEQLKTAIAAYRQNNSFTHFIAIQQQLETMTPLFKAKLMGMIKEQTMKAIQSFNPDTYARHAQQHTELSKMANLCEELQKRAGSEPITSDTMLSLLEEEGVKGEVLARGPQFMDLLEIAAIHAHTQPVKKVLLALMPHFALDEEDCQQRVKRLMALHDPEVQQALKKDTRWLHAAIAAQGTHAELEYVCPVDLGSAQRFRRREDTLLQALAKHVQGGNVETEFTQFFIAHQKDFIPYLNDEGSTLKQPLWLAAEQGAFELAFAMIEANYRIMGNIRSPLRETFCERFLAGDAVKRAHYFSKINRLLLNDFRTILQGENNAKSAMDFITNLAISQHYYYGTVYNPSFILLLNNFLYTLPPTQGAFENVKKGIYALKTGYMEVQKGHLNNNYTVVSLADGKGGITLVIVKVVRDNNAADRLQQARLVPLSVAARDRGAAHENHCMPLPALNNPVAAPVLRPAPAPQVSYVRPGGERKEGRKWFWPLAIAVFAAITSVTFGLGMMGWLPVFAGIHYIALWANSTVLALASQSLLMGTAGTALTMTAAVLSTPSSSQISHVERVQARRENDRYSYRAR